MVRGSRGAVDESAIAVSRRGLVGVEHLLDMRLHAQEDLTLPV